MPLDIAKCSLRGKITPPPSTLRTTDVDETTSGYSQAAEADPILVRDGDTDPGCVGTQCLQTKSYRRTPRVTYS